MRNASAGPEDFLNADHMGGHADTKDVLMEAAYLAGAMVDLIHGQWASNGSGFPRQRIATTFHNLLNVSQALLSGASQEASWHDMSLARRILNRVQRAVSATAHRHAVKHSLTEIHVDDLRRLATIHHDLNSRIVSHSNGVEQRVAQSKEPLRLHWDDLAVVYEASLLHRSRGDIVRALSGVTKIRDAIQQNALTVHPVGPSRRLDGLMPFNPWGVSDSRWGDVELPERSEEDTSKQRAVNLLNMSIAISKESMHARRNGIDSPTQEELGALFLGTIQMKACLLLDKVMAHFEATLSSGGYGTSQTPVSRIHPHALLHMENLYRVCLYRLVNSTRSYPDGFVSSREKLTESAVEFYDQLERTVKEDETVEVKMQALMISTFRQNKAILLSEISPTVFFNSDQLDSNHVKKLDEHIEDEAKEEKKFIPDGTHLTASRSEDSEEKWEAALNKFQADLQERRRSTDDLHREVLRAIKYDGWERLEDRPAYLKSAFRTLTQSDLVERADPRSDHNSILQATIGWLGNPSSQNVMGKPSSGTRTMASLLERTDRDSESLHLVHLPQGGINRAQAAVGLAYMNSILRSVYNTSTEAPVGADSGIFQDLSGLFEPSKKTEGGALRITAKDIPNKIQFTLRHKKNDKRKGRKPDEYRLDVDLSELFAGDAKSDQQKATAQYRRSNLTRVNKQDSLMYIAKAMNDLQHVLENQLGRPALQQRMDRAARSSGSFPSLFSEGIDAPHVHELLYLAMDAATSPLRLIDVSYTSVGDTQEAQQQVAIDGLLRCSMARLFALGTRLEALARVLVECPLKDPYQSASVLLLDQIRVLLKFHHTDWLEARASHKTPAAGHRFSQTVADNLSRFKNERRQRLFHGLECNELTDAEARTEPSTSYIIEYGLAELEDQKHLIERSKSRLEFDGEDDLSKAWGLYFHSARNLYKEIYAEMDNDDPTLPKQEDGAPSTKRDPSQDERKIHQAMNYLKENTQREWILWARLAMFPPCFVGRSLLSGTTTKDLNINLTPDDNSRTSIAKPMLFGTVKDAVMDLGD